MISSSFKKSIPNSVLVLYITAYYIHEIFKDSWWALTVETLHDITFVMFYASATAFAFYNCNSRNIDNSCMTSMRMHNSLGNHIL